jgi:two-component system, NtrC family, sensor kinase
MSAHYGTGEINKTYKNVYSILFRKFILLTFICSMVPLLLVGGGIHYYYSKISGRRMAEYLQAQVEYHRKILEFFLKERVSDLKLVAFAKSLNELREYSNLRRAYEMVNEQKSFLDLGVLNEAGRHLAYIGPYNLLGNDYSQEVWFKEVRRKGVYISDMFMGFRNIPHFAMAVARSEEGQDWILRATMDSDILRSLVEEIKIGETGEVYLLNSEGTFQSSPRFSGKIMEKASLPLHLFSQERGLLILEGEDKNPEANRRRQIVAYAWLKDPRWVLVLKQDYSEALRDVSYADKAIGIFLLMSILAIMIVSGIITQHMVKIVKHHDAEVDALNKKLLQANKLASVGELAAGVAHEINNPLACILTEKQIIKDLCSDTISLDEGFKTELFESLLHIDTQVRHCNQITRSLLGFSRHSRVTAKNVPVNSILQEIVALLKKRVMELHIQFDLDLEEDLPNILGDRSQLQQVFHNLIVNAVDAHEGKPQGTIRIKTRSNNNLKRAEVTIVDTGSGIPPDDLERIFDPFFTTKPVGKGTGLGLSISYGIIKYMGGDIIVKSTIGIGTEFTLFLPLDS